MKDDITCPTSTSRNNFSSALFALLETSLNCPTYKAAKCYNKHRFPCDQQAKTAMSTS